MYKTTKSNHPSSKAQVPDVHSKTHTASSRETQRQFALEYAGHFHPGIASPTQNQSTQSDFPYLSSTESSPVSNPGEESPLYAMLQHNKGNDIQFELQC
jgi:hypothetical protein